MGKQYLTFALAGTVYAVNVFQVREVLAYTPPQELPSSDPIIAGLIRSREQSIPVVSLRRKFGLGDKAADGATRIIVLEINNYEEGSISVFGALADSVNEVLDLDAIGFEDTPDLGHSPAAAFIEGIGRQGDAFIIILDVDKIFSFSELSEMEGLDNKAVAPEYAPYTQEVPRAREAQAEDSRPEDGAAAEESRAAPAGEALAAGPQEAAAPEREAPEEEASPPEACDMAPQEGERPPQAPAPPQAEAACAAEAGEPAPRAAPEAHAQEEEAPHPVPDKASQEEEAPKPAQPQQGPLREDDADGRYDALSYAPEDFELL